MGQWAYLDVLADTDLVPQIPAPIAEEANPPLAGATAPCIHLQRNFYILDNKVYWSEGPDAVTGNGLTQFPPLNFIAWQAKPVKLRSVTLSTGPALLVYTSSFVGAILGNGTAGNIFMPTEYVPTVGLGNYNGETMVGSTAYLMTTKGKFVSLDPSAGYVEQGFPIGDQFKKVTTGGFNAALFNPATCYVSWCEISSEDTAVYVANGLGQWFRFSPVASPESGYLWSPIGSLANGSSAMQSIETSPGIEQLLVGARAGVEGAVLYRDDTVFGDWDGAEYQPYPSWDVKGNIVLCSSGEVAEVAHIGLKSAAEGARPKVSLLFGEIKPTAQTPFDELEITDTDPPNLDPPTTVYSDRYSAMQNGVCPLCDNFQLKVDYGEQMEPDELLMFAIYGAKHSERKSQ
jgi:hypothetical protein